jgi:hypothetical protein
MIEPAKLVPMIDNERVSNICHCERSEAIPVSALTEIASLRSQ